MQLLYLSLAMSISACFVTILKTNTSLELDKKRLKVPKFENLLSSGKYKLILWDCFIILLHPYPFLVGKGTTMYNTVIDADIYYNYNDFLQMASMIRIVKMGIILIHITKWGTNSSQRICMMYGCEADTMFGVKAMMKKYPLKFMFCNLLLGAIYFAILVKYCESPMNKVGLYTSSQDLHQLDNCLWLVIVTMTTVGYGDLFPRTVLGRAVIFVCAVYGVIVVSVIVVAIQNTLEFTILEEKAFTCINKLDSRKDLYKQATRMISKILSFSRRPPTEPNKLKQCVRDLRSISHNFMKNVR